MLNIIEIKIMTNNQILEILKSLTGTKILTFQTRQHSIVEELFKNSSKKVLKRIEINIANISDYGVLVIRQIINDSKNNIYAIQFINGDIKCLSKEELKQSYSFNAHTGESLELDPVDNFCDSINLFGDF